MKTAGIILAAGASRRLGKPKQLTIVGAERLLERAVRSCEDAGLQPVFVVLGAHAEQIMAECDLFGAEIIRNDAWESGASSSIHAGLQALDESIDAVVLMTCDMPFVTSEHLCNLVGLANRMQMSVGSKGSDWQGVPACFIKSAFPDLLALSGDMGARKLLKEAPFVELANDLDIDTEADLVAGNKVAARMH